MAMMNKAAKVYFAILHKDPHSAVGVVFPDLPGCFSAGDTYDEAVRNAHEALRLYAEIEASRGRRLPDPRAFDALYADTEIREEASGAPFVGVLLDETESSLASGASAPSQESETQDRISDQLHG